ncbi:carboxypeptidase T [Pilimelia anulata]|uniref:Zinc carboxypeptidase n=1 Tax=Pilimelia anulata TaxID=53371 RepID=A0A8J3BBT6_9ACTN|nr:M14 family metallopeptidase [Pilimelia anulata]GGJ95201.1 carboxypeptidase T [Pilimelia anulata]
MRLPTHPGRRVVIALALSLALGGTLTAVGPVAATGTPTETTQRYVVFGAQTWEETNAVAATGAAVDYVEHGKIYISATPAELAAVHGLGLTTKVEAPPAEPGMDAFLTGFPANMQKYHDYAEMTDAINKLVASKPEIAQKLSIGKSYEGRDLPLIKISDNVKDDEQEPEYLISAHHHAREHLTVEMALYLLNMFINEYGKDERVTKLVNEREIWVIPSLNPDGSEFDISGSKLAMWRKNRQPNQGGQAGTDLNRNYGYKWGCCNGSSGSTGSETYRGTAAFSSPETQRIRDFVNSRKINGKQQITVNLDFHTYGELILWPYGYTNKTVEPGMTQDDVSTFSTIGKKMAATNKYDPKQASGLYITDGSSLDWLWAEHKIFGYTFEMWGGSGGFYPADTYIDKETARNRESALILGDLADCPYRAINKQDQYCK